MSESERSSREAIKVRQVTDVHGNFSAQGQGEPGTFSLQFVLDDGRRSACCCSPRKTPGR